MADTNSNDSLKRRKHNSRFVRKLVPDMTPMVGLGFMLVTFFIMAADFAKPAVLELAMPVRPRPHDAPGEISCGGGVMTLLLGKNHQVHYYFGLNADDYLPEVHTTNLGAAGLRQVLLQQQRENPRIIVLIKTTSDAKYKDMVDVLDEMKIANQRKYALVDIHPADIDLLKLKTM